MGKPNNQKLSVFSIAVLLFPAKLETSITFSSANFLKEEVRKLHKVQ